MNQDVLLERIKNGDRSAYAELYNTYVNKLFSYGKSLSFSDNTCMDAIQDVFCRIFTHKEDLNNIQNIHYYLLRSLKNRLLDIYNHEKAIRFDSINEAEFLMEVSVMDTIIDTEERDRLRNRVESLLNLLTNNQKEAIYLRYMQEMEYDEIAELLNISPESTRKLVYRGILKLRSHSGLGISIILLYLREYYAQC